MITKHKELYITMPNGKVYRAVVRDHHVALQDGANNNEIFADLCVEKYSFCSAAYGYSTREGNWPYFRSGDYAALKRLFAALCARGCVITETGATQKKHIDKTPCSNVCAQGTPCAPCAANEPCAKPAKPAVDVQHGYQPQFRSPLCSMTAPKY